MKEYVFDGVNLSIIVSTILIFLGWIKSTPYVFKLASFIVKIIVGVFLVIRFSFLNESPLGPFEKKVCFVSGMYILVFTIGDYIREFAYGLRPWLSNTGLLHTQK